jgi:alkylation response protein AidB-like acyl-CoA dehydrogenase
MEGPDAIERARALIPLLRAAAPRIEAARELTPDVVAAMHEARLFRLMLPRSLGGEELDPVSLSQVTEAIAMGDASAAWCLGQGSGCAMSAAYLSPEAARKVFGPANAVLAWGAGAQGKAAATTGGYVVTGKWLFASGSRHATWLGAHCKVVEADGRPRLGPDGKQVERTALLRREQAAIDDVWHVMGLRGTGSDGYGVTELFVPEAETLNRDNAAERREAAAAYKFTTTLAFAAAFGGVALGIARGALDDLLALAMDKTPRGARTTLRDSPVFQSDAAELEGRWRGARAYLHAAVAEALREAERGRELTLDRRVAVRLAATTAINQATEVTAAAYRAAGATAIFNSQPFERRMRDAHAVSQQAQARATHFETVGRHLLGLAPDTAMFL